MKSKPVLASYKPKVPLVVSEFGCTNSVTVPVTVKAIPATNFTFPFACSIDPTQFNNTTVIPAGETPIYVTGGYRANNVWWFIVATSAGNWYGINDSGITDFTPNSTPITGYNDDTNITEAWSGTTLFINAVDLTNTNTLPPPMYLTATATEFVEYSNNPGGPGYIWNYNPA